MQQHEEKSTNISLVVSVFEERKCIFFGIARNVIQDGSEAVFYALIDSAGGSRRKCLILEESTFHLEPLSFRSHQDIACLRTVVFLTQNIFFFTSLSHAIRPGSISYACASLIFTCIMQDMCNPYLRNCIRSHMNSTVRIPHSWHRRLFFLFYPRCSFPAERAGF